MPAPSLQTPTEALAARARVLLDMGRPRDALPLLARAAAAEPGSARLHCLLALAYHNAGEAEKCVQAAETAIRAAPDGEWGHRLRANGLTRLPGRSGEALEAAQEAVRCAPREPRALYTLALALLKAGQVENADTTARALRDVGPDTTWAHEAMGLVALRQGKLRNAEEHFRATLRVSPLSYSAHNNLGVTLGRQGRLPQAIACYHQAAMLMPLDAKAPKNMDKTARRYLFGPALACLVMVTGMAIPYAFRPNTWNWLMFSGTAGITLFALLLLGWYRWRMLPPGTRAVVRRRTSRLRHFRP